MQKFQDMSQISPQPWPHWTGLSVNTLELVGNERSIRVVLFERLEPGEHTRMSASHVPRHRNQYDVLYVNLQLPLTDVDDATRAATGTFTYRPECLLTEGGVPMPAVEPSTDYVAVNLYLHTDGPSGEPLLRLADVAAMVDELDRETPGAMRHERGEYVAPDGEVHEALEICWERKMGRAFPYPDPPRLAGPVVVTVEAVPWYEVANMPGVRVKALAAVGPTGPLARLMMLSEGARLEAVTLTGSRFVAVLAGGVVQGSEQIGERSVVLGSDGDRIDAIVAAQSTLLWVVDWPSAEAFPNTTWSWDSGFR